MFPFEKLGWLELMGFDSKEVKIALLVVGGVIVAFILAVGVGIGLLF